MLPAAADARVAAMRVIDPVDNTGYTPLGPGFPTASDALRRVASGRSLPVAIVGSRARAWSASSVVIASVASAAARAALHAVPLPCHLD
jgi:hypothetical protein